MFGLATGLRAEDQLRAATPDEITLFKEAIKNTTQDTEHWAYTETTVFKSTKGKVREETVVRFDPSKPWPEQYTPLKIEDQPPTARQLKKYRTRGEKRGEALARTAATADATTPGEPTTQKPAPGKKVTLDLNNPRVLKDEGDRLVYEAALKASAKDIPVDKFEVLVVVGKAARQVEHISLRLRESFRVKLVAKVKAGEASADFAVVDPKYGPVMTSAIGSFGASLLFVPVSGIFTNTRTEWERVKPYNDRLKVKLGPLEVLDF
ncbi:MAG TPA: hypothetical protein PLQ52_11835 [Lacunisphaera sp.]|nr:hypothetical protein [Lacunisphaera sp.]HQY06744.1 hypothetical protein [Lacunisphaera sp.]